MLAVERLDVAYGGSQVLWGVDLRVSPAEVLCLMGRNGVGKTTLLKAVMGLLPVRAGRVTFDGADITRWSSDRRARAGIGYVPQGREIFPHLTVQENLRVAQLGCGRKDSMDDVLELFPALRRFLSRKGGVLSGGEQQMLAIGRGLACAPRLLMLDEPSMGLAPSVADTIFDRISQIHREDGVTILLVEQRVAEALERSDHGYVLETGHIVLEGRYEALLADDRVRRSYLGLTEA